MFIVLGVIGILADCAERDRLISPNQNDGIGPVTLIDHRGQSDTTIDAGRSFLVNGRAIDLDAGDTVYFLVTGGSQGFPPLRQAIQLQVYAVDRQSNQGAPAFRHISFR